MNFKDERTKCKREIEGGDIVLTENDQYLIAFDLDGCKLVDLNTGKIRFKSDDMGEIFRLLKIDCEGDVRVFHNNEFTLTLNQVK